jgi:glycerol-3-phosphate acyltransferase PlsY
MYLLDKDKVRDAWKFALPVVLINIAIVVLLLVGIVTLVTDYIVAATTNTIIIVPAWLGIASHSWILALILLVGSVVIAWKHRENYVRMYNGTEIRFRKAGRGDYRVDK